MTKQHPCIEALLEGTLQRRVWGCLMRVELHLIVLTSFLISLEETLQGRVWGFGVL